MIPTPTAAYIHVSADSIAAEWAKAKEAMR